MDRKLISHRIGSILDDISRLSNALYALDTTDIQRYPDNYETLSIDAAYGQSGLPAGCGI